MQNKTILVSGASGIVGYGILKTLKKCQNLTLIGTTIYDDSIASAFCDIFERAPRTDAPEYLDWLISIIKRYKIDMIIPSIEADMNLWNKHRKELENEGAFPLLNNSALINICLDKWSFYQKLVENNFKNRIYTTIEPNYDELKLPVLLKPRCGFGSKGIEKIFDFETLKKYKNQIGNELMLQELIIGDDKEITASAFFDKNSEMKAQMMLERKLSVNGFTEKAKVVYVEKIVDAIKDLSKIFKPVGPTNFQFRKDDNGMWKLLEINPRISSSSSIRMAFGYNEAKMCIDYFLNNKEIVQPKILQGHAIRYTEDYIVYENSANI